MKPFELQDLVKEIYKYFKNQKVPDMDVLELWTEQLKIVRGEAIGFITAYIKANKNSLPTNLPRVIEEGWQEYLNSHPEKVTHAEEVAGWDCPDCHGGGVLHFRKRDPRNELTYTYIALCSGCRASRKKFGYVLHEGGKICNKTESGSWVPSGEFVPAMLALTQQEIIDNGWELLPPENQYLERLEKIPEHAKYSALLGIKRDILKIHGENLADQAKSLVDNENFTKHEAAMAVRQAVDIRVKEARGAENPGDIVKRMFDI